jgi:DNA replication and repair protein RecF
VEIKNLTLENFRNFKKIKVNFHPRLTLIIGPNGSGKTNICEAIGLLSFGKSFRAKSDIEFLSFGANQAKIGGEIDGEEKEKRDLVFVKNQKEVIRSYFLNGVKKHLAFFLGSFLAIIFNPWEIDFLFDSPSQRRYHLDLFLSFCDRNYYRELIAYNKVLERRNRILARIWEKRAREDELSFWDQKQLLHGEAVAAKRREFFEFLKKRQKKFKVEYWQNQISAEKLERQRDYELERRVSLFGPHRDDFRFNFCGRDLLLFGSRGEQRLSVLALKLSELEFAAKVKGGRPILVLDDIFSELDKASQELVLKVILRQQTIITSIDQQVEKFLPEDKEVINVG